jgi:hypothetical protein
MSQKHNVWNCELIFWVFSGYPWVKYTIRTLPDPTWSTGEFSNPYPCPSGMKPVGIHTHESNCHPYSQQLPTACGYKTYLFAFSFSGSLSHRNILLVTCSQKLYIKNKATQILMIKDIRPSKHYFLLDIIIFRRRSWRTYLHHFNMLRYKHGHKKRRKSMNNHL